MLDIRFEGFEQVDAALAALIPALSTEAENAVMDATQTAKATGESLTPVRTGYLKSRNQVPGPTRDGGTISVTWENDADYALYVAMGTRHQAAQDFMTPGIAAGMKRLRERLNGLL